MTALAPVREWSRKPSAVVFEDRLEALSRDVDVGGERIHYAEAGHGPAILFCHGIPLSMSSWQDLFFALAPHYRVIAVDMPGYGRSSKPAGDYDLATIGAQIARLCAAIGADRIHVVGSSFGAAVAVTLALEHPRLVDRLVLINSVGIAGGTHAIERLVRSALIRNIAALALLQQGLGRSIFRAKLRASYETIDPDEALVDHYYRLLLRDHGERSFLQTLQRFDEAALQARLPHLTHPVLSIWGGHDRVLPLSKSLKVQSLLPNCWSTVIAAAGHLPHEERPEECTRRIHDFLRMPTC
jgi:4,5:9,10-diseco-3-hydroxy-5,9,17-trioxoandrosta-1(10),2-diene-4-oate hydrolase